MIFIINNRSDNCIKNYYYSTLRKHLRRINKGLKVCNVGKYSSVRGKNIGWDQNLLIEII